MNTRNRQVLALMVYRCALEAFESFREQNVGADLAYLQGAILDDGQVDWTPEGYGRDAPALLPALRAQFPAGHSLWQFVKLPAEQSAPFKVGEFVAVVDLRDGAVVEPRAKIEGISLRDGKPCATLDAGFCVSLKCLRHLP